MNNGEPYFYAFSSYHCYTIHQESNYVENYMSHLYFLRNISQHQALRGSYSLQQLRLTRTLFLEANELLCCSNFGSRPRTRPQATYHKVSSPTRTYHGGFRGQMGATAPFMIKIQLWRPFQAFRQGKCPLS